MNTKTSVDSARAGSSATECSNITEAQVMAFLAAKSAEYANLFPEIVRGEPVHAGVSVNFRQVYLGIYTSDKFESAHGYGSTFAEAAIDLRNKLGTPESRAAALREQAAKLNAEADALTAQPKLAAAA